MFSMSRTAAIPNHSSASLRLNRTLWPIDLFRPQPTEMDVCWQRLRISVLHQILFGLDHSCATKKPGLQYEEKKRSRSVYECHQNIFAKIAGHSSGEANYGFGSGYFIAL